MQLDPELEAERALWLAVINQAIMDNDTKWLSMRCEDFLTICDYAGLKPEYVLRGVK